MAAKGYNPAPKGVEIPKESLKNWMSGNYRTEVQGRSDHNMPKQSAPGTGAC